MTKQNNNVRYVNCFSRLLRNTKLTICSALAGVMIFSGVGFAQVPTPTITATPGNGFEFSTGQKVSLFIGTQPSNSYFWTNGGSAITSYTQGTDIFKLDGNLTLSNTAAMTVVGGLMTNDSQLNFSDSTHSISVENTDSSTLVTAGFGYLDAADFTGNVVLGDVTTKNASGGNYGVVFVNATNNTQSNITSSGSVTVGNISATSTTSTDTDFAIGFLAGDITDGAITTKDIVVDAGGGGGAGLKVSDITDSTISINGKIEMTSNSVTALNGFVTDLVGGNTGSTINITGEIAVKNDGAGGAAGIVIQENNGTSAKDINGNITVGNTISVTSNGTHAVGFYGGYYGTDTDNGTVTGNISLQDITIIRTGTPSVMAMAAGIQLQRMNIGSSSQTSETKFSTGDITVTTAGGVGAGVNLGTLVGSNGNETTVEIGKVATTNNGTTGINDTYGVVIDGMNDYSTLKIDGVTTTSSDGNNIGVAFVNPVATTLSDIIGGSVTTGAIKIKNNTTTGTSVWSQGFAAGDISDSKIEIASVSVEAGAGNGVGVSVGKLSTDAEVEIGNVDMSGSSAALNGVVVDSVNSDSNLEVGDVSVVNSLNGDSFAFGVQVEGDAGSTNAEIGGNITTGKINVTSSGTNDVGGFVGGTAASNIANVSGTINLGEITVSRTATGTNSHWVAGVYLGEFNVGSDNIKLNGEITATSDDDGNVYGVYANSLAKLDVTKSITATSNSGNGFGIYTYGGTASVINILNNVAITGSTASIALGGTNDTVNVTAGTTTPWDNGGKKFVLGGVENLAFSGGLATLSAGSKRETSQQVSVTTSTTVNGAGLTVDANFFDDKAESTLNGVGWINLKKSSTPGKTGSLAITGTNNSQSNLTLLFDPGASLMLGDGITSYEANNPHLIVTKGATLVFSSDTPNGFGGVVLGEWSQGKWDDAPMFATIDGGVLVFDDARTNKTDEWSITPVKTTVGAAGATIFVGPNADTKVRIGDVTGTGSFRKEGYGTLIIGKEGSGTTFDISGKFILGNVYGNGNVVAQSGVNIIAGGFAIDPGTTLDLTSANSKITSSDGLLWGGTIKVAANDSAIQINIGTTSNNVQIYNTASLIFAGSDPINSQTVLKITGAAGTGDNASLRAQLEALIQSGGLAKIDAEVKSNPGGTEMWIDLTSAQYLTVEQAASNLGETTTNANEVASAMDDIANVNPDFKDALYGLNSDAAVRQFLRANLGGELMAESQTMALWSPHTRVFSHLNSLTALDNDLSFRGQLRAPGFGYRFWFDGYYLSENVSSDNVAYKYDISRPGMMLGLDMHSEKNNTFGLMFGYGAPKANNDIGEIAADDYTLGLYARYNVGWNTTINGFVGYGIQSYHYNIAGIEQDYNGQAIYVTLEAMKKIPTYRGSHVFPLVAFDYQQGWTDAVSINGNGFALPQDIDKGDISRSVLRVGLNGQFSNIRTRLQYGYLVGGNEYGSSNVTYRYGGASASRVLTGVNVGRSFANIGFGGDLNMGAFRVFADYDFDFGERRTAHTGQIGVDVKW